MQQIDTISTSPDQRMSLVLDNNETVDFRLYFVAMQQSWFYDFTYKNRTVNGSKVVLTPNSLRQFRRILPFGIAFLSDGDITPFQIDDFSSGRVKMYLLNSADVKQIEREIYNL